MNRSTILYWTFTILFSAMMVFSAIPDVLSDPQAVVFMTHLGYPAYIIPFLGIAKVLGVIAILIPGFARIKEWAYAGLFFDLIGALYSVLASGATPVEASFFVLPFALGIASYYFYHRLLKNKQSTSNAELAIA